jgi:hypothetical protein
MDRVTSKDRLANTRARLTLHDNERRILQDLVDNLQQQIWLELRPTCQHVAARIGDDIYVCQYCHLDMST